MNVSDMIGEIAQEADLTQVQTRQVIKVIFDIIQNALVDGQEVKLGSVGKLTVVMRVQRTARDIRRGKTVNVPEHRAIKFKTFAGMKESLNSKKQVHRRIA